MVIVLQEEELFDNIVLVDLYDSPKGLNFMRHPNILTPIHDPAFGKKTLDQFVLFQILQHQNDIILSTGDKELDLYFFCHSLGGLVIRSVLQNLLQPTAIGNDRVMYIGRGRVRAVITLGTAHQGAYLGRMFASLKMPLQGIFEMNKVVYGLLGKNAEKEAIPKKDISMNQFSKASNFIQSLNSSFDSISQGIIWISVAGTVTSPTEAIVPLTFRKMLKDVPNDGVIEVNATILPDFKHHHILVDDCSHADLIRWKSSEGGARAWSLIKKMLLQSVFQASSD